MERFSLIDEDLINAALSAYEASKAVEPDADALRVAISAALVKHEQRVQARIARAANAYAAALIERTGADEEDPGPQAIREFAGSLMMELPGEDYMYEPEQGDVIEVSLVGELYLETDTCPNCGHEHGSMMWGVTDRYTNNQFWFEDTEFSKARVRVVMRGSDFDGIPLESV